MIYESRVAVHLLYGVPASAGKASELRCASKSSWLVEQSYARPPEGGTPNRCAMAHAARLPGLHT